MLFHHTQNNIESLSWLLPSPLPPDYFSDRSEPRSLGSSHTNLFLVPWGHWAHSLLRAFVFTVLSSCKAASPDILMACPSFPSGVCPNVTVSGNPSLLALYVISHSHTQITFYSRHCFILLYSSYSSFVSPSIVRLMRARALLCLLLCPQYLEYFLADRHSTHICWMSEWVKTESSVVTGLLPYLCKYQRTVTTLYMDSISKPLCVINS